jgi:hypothetical protein
MMADIQRKSPVHFNAGATRTEVRDHWTVALEYDDEGSGPYLVDLSHKTRWDLQSASLADYRPCDVPVPEKPGQCVLEKGVMLNRMNRTQVAVWHLAGHAAALPDDPAYTDVSEGAVFLALFGPRAFSITEKLSSLDFLDPGKQAPFLLQGPFSHVPCQIVTLETGEGGSGGILFTCSRGYGHSMVHAIMEAGAEFGLRPAGENRFTRWLGTLAG